MSYSKYYLYKKQYSTDNGVTWYDVTPLEQVPSGNPIGTYSTLSECESDAPHDYSGDYLTFVAVDSGTFTFYQEGKGTLQYSTDSGSTWTTLTNTQNTHATTVSVAAGNKILWKGTLYPDDRDYKDGYRIGRFTSTGRYNIEGNLVSITANGPSSGGGMGTHWYEALFRDNKIISAENMVLPNTVLSDYCYDYMFSGCTSLATAPSLPATTLADYCYAGMFAGCSSLTTAPSLPATTLVYGCYAGMFAGCSSLTTAPSLPATTLVYGCYENMFAGCSSLTTAPSLPATTLVYGCYENMFAGCSSLTTAPSLPATTLASECYYEMFKNCTSLTTAPVLSATTLASYCYYGMFDGCTSLATVPSNMLPATTLINSCYDHMFYGCTSLTTAPDLSATTLVSRCYMAMFYGCSSLSYIKCLATDISASYCTYNWVGNVASTGTFVKNANMQITTGKWTRGPQGIPIDWTVQDAS